MKNLPHIYTKWQILDKERPRGYSVMSAGLNELLPQMETNWHILCQSLPVIQICKNRRKVEVLVIQSCLGHPAAQRPPSVQYPLDPPIMCSCMPVGSPFRAQGVKPTLVRNHLKSMCKNRGNSLATSRWPEPSTSNFQDVATGQNVVMANPKSQMLVLVFPVVGAKPTRVIHLSSGNKAI